MTHIMPKKNYFMVSAALFALLVLTVAVSHMHLGRLAPYVALTIAIAKAVLIILYFMHVKYSSRLTQIFVVSGFVWLSVMIGFTLCDYLSRGWP